MEVTHGIALAFSVIFVIIGVTFRSVMFWLMSLGYTLVLAWFAVINSWEVLFFIPLFAIGVISIVGFVFSALNGDLV